MVNSSSRFVSVRNSFLGRTAAALLIYSFLPHSACYPDDASFPRMPEYASLVPSCCFVLLQADESVVEPQTHGAVAGSAASDDTTITTVSADELARVKQIQTDVMEKLQSQLAQLPPIDPAAVDAVDQFSRRGDLHMFAGAFDRAVADYRAMIDLRPQLDASHWRLGIALFYAGDPQGAAAQFDRYHTFDDVDRENGIWRYLSHYRAFGSQKARAQLLRYTKDDRPPFPHVYQLFEGRLTPHDVMQAISDEQAAAELQSQRFYADLYIGMHWIVEEKVGRARPHLVSAVLNPWPQRAGYGPAYMWHVARLQVLQTEKSNAEAADSSSEPAPAPLPAPSPPPAAPAASPPPSSMP